jgi:hypothetical protein
LREPKEKAMANYRMAYGDDEQVVRETFNDVEFERGVAASERGTFGRLNRPTDGRDG